MSQNIWQTYYANIFSNSHRHAVYMEVKGEVASSIIHLLRSMAYQGNDFSSIWCQKVSKEAQESIFSSN
jgi:hypothetical protein